VDGVLASDAGASITLDGAARSGRGLGRSVIDLVTLAFAAALECVVETDPVTNFVCQSTTD
jgi:hypothetical protein